MAKLRNKTLGQQEKQKAKNFVGTVKKLWQILSRYKRLLSFVLLLVIISSILSLLGPYLIGRTIDEFIVTEKREGLAFRLMVIAAVYLLLSVTLYLQNYWMIHIAQKTVFLLRSKLFRHLHRLPIRFFDERQHGELMSRVTNDVENVSQTLNNSIIQIFSSILTLLGAVCVMLSLSPLLTAVTLTVVPVMFAGMKWITSRTRRLFKEQQRNLGDLNGFIEETISGQKIIKMFSQEQKVMAEFREKNERLKQSGYWAQTISGFIPKLLNVLNNLSFALIAGVGGILALKGKISVGVIVIFVEYARQFIRPLNDLANQYNTLLSAVAGAERVFEILEMEVEETDKKQAIDVADVKGEVAFQDVSFSYKKDGDTIRNINFYVKQGETVALVGPTGAGKTTIINLLSRFYDPDSGTILLDGKDITTIKRSSLRKHMGFVQQDPFLFETTIRENIRYGRLHATDKEVEEAAKLANAHSFIMRLPNGYDTVLTQNGTALSQGQKQLLSIARAILADPSILILDEATSNIDTITELKIQEALERLMKNRATFVIAHRLNTVQNADQILVLNDGQIIEKGTHESLLQKKGFYYELFQSQWKHEAI
ncbi:ABC transporter ATP-binding protein [Bacillus alveayuensis]|uniref:ABC transporter ATP-binding protein n=1 Tax=Aeribacillus alveayuensis TaxID=279215 RepID=UPI0005CD1AE8|nr:ABC transporter ATP-binding protein [Bacillus alveayuensis]